MMDPVLKQNQIVEKDYHAAVKKQKMSGSGRCMFRWLTDTILVRLPTGGCARIISIATTQIWIEPILCLNAESTLNAE